MEPSPPEVSPPDSGWTPWSQPAEADEAEPDVADGEHADGPDIERGATPAGVAEPRRSGAGHEGGLWPSVSLGAIIVAIGSLVVVFGTLLETVSVGIAVGGLTSLTLSQTFFDTDDGKVVAALGAVILVVALTTMVQRTSRLVAPIVVAAGGLAVFGIALYDRIDIDSSSNEALDRLAASLQGVVQVDIGPALYFVMGGGVLVVIGAVLAARDR